MIKRILSDYYYKPLVKLCSHYNLQLRPLITDSPKLPQLGKPVNPSELLRVCTILYQQQNSPDLKVYSYLQKFSFHLSHEFFLQVCNKFPYSHKPVYKFYKFTQKQPDFTHTSITLNKIINVIGNAKNIDLLWEVLMDMGHRKLVNDKTFRIALKHLGSARELKKCVEIFHLMNNSFGYAYNLDTLNKVVETLCGSKLVFEAKFVVFKLRQWIQPNEVTFQFLIVGFCQVGDLFEASKIWNIMVDEGFDPDNVAIGKMMETLFKRNQFREALTFFRSLENLNLSSYRLVISWMCKRGKLGEAYFVYDEMLKRGIQADNATLAALVYGLLSKGRVREAYTIVAGIEELDISVYHGLIKGWLRLRRASEATQVFREMIKRGCEPTMHTYIMLLQGHLGKWGRRGADPGVNFDTIFVGGLVKVGKTLKATKYVERIMSDGSFKVPKFDYNNFLHDFSNEEGVLMFEEVGKRLKEVGYVNLADIFMRYGEKMTTRERRRKTILSVEQRHTLVQDIGNEAYQIKSHGLACKDH